MAEQWAHRGQRPAVVLLGAGHSIHVRRWASALAEQGDRVVVTSWVPADPIPGVELRYPGAAGTGGGGRVRAGLRVLATGWWFRRQIRHLHPDVVHVHSVGRAGLLALALPRGVPRVVTPWGSDLRFAARSRSRGWVARRVLRRADLVVSTSSATTREVTSRYPVAADRAVTLSWGVEDALLRVRDDIDRSAVRARFGIPLTDTVLLSMRGAAAVYRTDEILGAFAATARDRPDLHLVLLAGHAPAEPAAGAARRRALDRARSLVDALPGRLTLIDRTLTPMETFGLMRASDIAISVPRWDQRSSAVLEAALAGCRLLLADLPAYRELLADGLVADLVPEPLDRELAVRLGPIRPLESRCQAINHTFIERSETWSRQVTAMRQLYRGLLGSNLPALSTADPDDTRILQ